MWLVPWALSRSTISTSEVHHSDWPSLKNQSLERGWDIPVSIQSTSILIIRFTCLNLLVSFKKTCRTGCVLRNCSNHHYETVHILTLLVLVICGSAGFFEEYILFMASWKSSSCSPIEGEPAVDYHDSCHVWHPFPGLGSVDSCLFGQERIRRQRKVEPAIGASRAKACCPYHLGKIWYGR